MKVNIKRAKAADLPTIKRLIAKFPKRLVQNPLPKASEFFVAENDGQIVACCALEVYSRKIAEIRSLAVEPSWRGKGIATKLVKACLVQVKRMKVHEALVITSRPSLFERLGFKTFHKERLALFKVFKVE